MKATPGRGATLPTIHKADDGRITIAEAKRLILDASPLEDAINVYAQVDDDGSIDLNGPIETTLAKDVNIHERHLDASFPALCHDLGIRPRWKYNPAQTDYSGVVNMDPFYSISHDEFVRVAELFGCPVVVGDAPQTKALPHPQTPGLYTLEEAAQAIAASLGWHEGARDTLKNQFMQAARSGLLTVRHPHTDAPYRPDPVHDFYELVTPADVNEWAARGGVSWRWEVHSLEPKAAPVVTPAPTAWVGMAKARAVEIIKRQREKDLYPSQTDIADEIAREFRRDVVMGADGKPLSGGYIKRHALKGISSAQDKRRSTSIRRGK